METALFNNRIVSVQGFLRAQSSPLDYPICPVCSEKLFLSATRSVKKTASFNHRPRDEEAKRCLLSYSHHPTYSWLEDVDIEEVEFRAQALRSSFYQLDNLKRAFMFLSRVTGKGAISHDVFELLVYRADKFNIWRYSGLPLWAVPYILLTFTDFYIRREGKETYVVRFVIDKPSRSKLNTIWLRPTQCKLVKYFVNKGKATVVFGAQASSERHASSSTTVGNVKNPLPFSEDEFNNLTADTAWITGGLESFLRRMTVAPVVGGESDSARVSKGATTASQTVKPDERNTQGAPISVPKQANQAQKAPVTEAQTTVGRAIPDMQDASSKRASTNPGALERELDISEARTSTLTSPPIYEASPAAARMISAQQSLHTATSTSSPVHTATSALGASFAIDSWPARGRRLWTWVKTLLQTKTN